MAKRTASDSFASGKVFRVQRLLFVVTVVPAVYFILSGLAVGEEVRTWSDESGRFKRQAIYEATVDEVVHLRGADGKTYKVPLAKLSSADREYVRAIATNARAADPFTAEDSGAAPEPVKSSPPREDGSQATQRDAEDPTLKAVDAEGVGKDVEKAKKNAYREAVRQVVGAYVDAESMAVNRKLIEDRVTMLSSAYVERSEEPEVEQTDDGLIRVRLVAYVRQTKVLDVLRDNKISVRVSSDSLVAELTTKTDQQEAQQDLMSRVFEGYPSKCFIATVEGQPRVEKQSDGSSGVMVRLKFAPDMDSFRKYSERIHTALSASDRLNGTFSSDGKKPNPNYDMKYVIESLFERADLGMFRVFPVDEQQRLFESFGQKKSGGLLEIPKVYSLWNGGREGQGVEDLKHGEWEKLRERQEREAKSLILVVLSKSMADNQRTTWRWYALTAEEARSWLPSACHPMSVMLTGKSGDNAEVFEDRFELAQLGFQVDDVRSGGNLVVYLAPFYVEDEFRCYIPSFTYYRFIPATEDEISGLKTLTCTLDKSEKTYPIYGITLER